VNINIEVIGISRQTIAIETSLRNITHRITGSGGIITGVINVHQFYILVITGVIAERADVDRFVNRVIGNGIIKLQVFLVSEEAIAVKGF
jgi:hypothetical protein